MGELEQLTDDPKTIEQLNRTSGWKLKGVVANTSLKLLLKYANLLNINRFAIKNTSQETNQELQFIRVFKQNYLSSIISAMIKILFERKEKFVGDQTIYCCLKFVNLCMQKKDIRKQLREHIPQIISDIPLMLMALDKKDLENFQNVRSPPLNI